MVNVFPMIMTAASSANVIISKISVDFSMIFLLRLSFLSPLRCADKQHGVSCFLTNISDLESSNQPKYYVICKKKKLLAN